MSYFKAVKLLELGGRRRPVLYADISVPVLQVPAGEAGGPGGLPNLLMMRRRCLGRGGVRRDEEDMHESIVVEDF